MGKIEIDIPKDVETKLDEMYPGEDRAVAVVRLLRRGLMATEETDRSATTANQDRLLALIRELGSIRKTPPFLTDEDIRRVRDEGRP